MWFTNLKWGLSEAQWCPLPAPARLTHNKIVIENSQEGNDHLVSILRPSAVRLLLAAGTTDITAHSTVEIVICIMSSVLHRFQTPLTLEQSSWRSFGCNSLYCKWNEARRRMIKCTLDNIHYAGCRMMEILRVESGGGAGVALVDINGLINMS